MVAAATGDENIARRNQFYLYRAPEELYDLVKDPNSMINLATDAAHREPREAARRRLLEWMIKTGDPCSRRAGGSSRRMSPHQ